MTTNLSTQRNEVPLSCSSQSSSATTIINHQPFPTMTASIITSSGSVGGGRAIDRYSPHLRDPLRSKSLNPVLPQSATRPKTYSIHDIPKRSSNKKASDTKKPSTAHLISPAGSQRYLLTKESKFSEDFVGKESAAPSAIVHELSRFQSTAKSEEISVILPLEMEMEMEMFQHVKVEQSSEAGAAASSSTTTTTSKKTQDQQIVVLRVSLHCKGCEGKVRKHISKMEGVTSFTTDLVNKKVTVVGDVTPLGVLNSISKVRNAQLWPSQPPAPAPAH